MTVYTRTNVPTPPGGATVSTFQVGTYNAVSDTWTLVLDLNDYVTWWIGNGSMKLDQPTKADSRSFNIRTPGERITKVQYKNRHVMVNLNLRGASTAAMLTSIRALLSAIENPPYTLRIALPGATQYTYADVVRIKHNIPADPLTILAKAIPKVTVDFECQPFFRGDRLTFQNLVGNPGFEAPAGGAGYTQASMPIAFSDPLSNLNAYTTVSGGAMTLSPSNTYPDIVLSDAPFRYYRLGESAGTTAYDIGGGTGATGTYTGAGVTYGSTALISGDTGKSVLLNGSTGSMSFTTTGGSTGNASITVEAWIQIAANPSATQIIVGYGSSGHSQAYLQITSAGKVQFAGFNNLSTLSGALTTGAPHHVVGVYDSVAGKIWTYVDSTATDAGTAVTAPTFTSPSGVVGVLWGASNQFGGNVQEAALYMAALSSTRVTAHYSAGHSGATGTVANAASVPASGISSFGSPIWGGTNGVQMWQCRFRWVTSLTAVFYLHRTNSSNDMKVFVDGANLTLYQQVAGTNHQLAQTAAVTTHEAWYWIQFSQFPTVSGAAPYLTATLFYDASGAVGTQVATVSAAAFDQVTAQSGVPMLSGSGAALAVGGLSSGAGNQVQLFGPGGWAGVPNGSGGTAQSSIAWDQTAANTYPNGPVTSFGAGRIDIPPAGTIDARIASNGLALGSTGIPIRTAGDTLSFSAWYKTSAGLSANAVVSLHANFYTSAFALISSSDAATATGAQTSWTQLSGTVVTPGTAAYCQLDLRVLDTTIAGESAGATIWFDNVLVWNQTQCAMSGMPYCELRFPGSPAQLMLSGVQGDVQPTPAALMVGTYFNNHSNTLTTLWLGRRLTPTANGRLIGFQAPSPASVYTAALDPTSYGGWVLVSAGTSSAGFSFIMLQSDGLGTYHHFSRFQATTTTPQVYNVNQQENVTGNALFPAGSAFSSVSGPTLAPLKTASTWTTVDAGLVALPPSGAGALSNNTQVQDALFQEWTGLGGVGTYKMNWQALLPVDASLLIASLNNPNNNTYLNWLWLYSDPLAISTGGTLGWTYSEEVASLPNPGAGMGASTFGTIFSGIGVNAVADPWLVLDPTPTSTVGSATGIAELLGILSDDQGDALALHTELQYAPLYLYPR